MTTPVEKMTVDSVVSVEKMNKIRDACEDLRAELLLEHGDDESSVGPAAGKLGTHTARTLLDAGIGIVATAYVRVAFIDGASLVKSASLVAGDRTYFGEPRIDAARAIVEIPVRGLSACGASVAPFQQGFPSYPWVSFASAAVFASDDAEWPWLIRANCLVGTAPSSALGFDDYLALAVTLIGY